MIKSGVVRVSVVDLLVDWIDGFVVDSVVDADEVMSGIKSG